MTCDVSSQAFDTEDNINRIGDWFDSGEKPVLVCPESLKIENAAPAKQAKGKLLFFVRLKEGMEITEKNFEKEIAVSEIGGVSPCEMVEAVARYAYEPVLTCTQNSKRWGEVAQHQVTDHYYTFLSRATILVGQMKGETRLPMPLDDAIDGQSASKSKITMLEGAIITWTTQIQDVISAAPDDQAVDPSSGARHYLTPDAEIEFWRVRASHLNSIWEQLQSPQIRRLLNVLNAAKSTYCSAFTRTVREVYDARLEANDNLKYLRTLSSWIQKLNDQDDFSGLIGLFKPIVHIILLIWKNSKFYNQVCDA